MGLTVYLSRDAEGRLEADGTLACSYHGWRFGPDGKCTAIPQVRGFAALRKC